MNSVCESFINIIAHLSIALLLCILKKNGTTEMNKVCHSPKVLQIL